MLAYRRFKPDVVIDDFSLTTAFASELTQTPRVTLLRTGLLPGADSGRVGERHSSNVDLARDIPDISGLGLSRPRSLRDLFVANAFVIPGIRSVEWCPEPADEGPSLAYCGPLIVGDYTFTDHRQPSRDFSDLDEFLVRNGDRPIVLCTFGNVAVPPAVIHGCLIKLLALGMALCSTFELEDVPAALRGSLFSRTFLPFHRICAHASVVVHHCGSGTYQYPIQYGVPAVTVPTRCYDRDEVARRLAESGASIHLDVADPQAFASAFEEAVLTLVDRVSPRRAAALTALAALKAESDRTAAAFSLDRVIEAALRDPIRRSPEAPPGE
jgi:UDP:flavonoid glycosyltransferase YjiC (YdhE family)